MGVPTQSSKGLRVSTRCRDLAQFVRAYHRYCEDSGVFISHARRSVGEVVAFSFDLFDGSAALAGVGAVIEQLPSSDNRFGRAGVVIALHRLSRNTRRVFDDLTAARTSSKERADETPPPIAEARAFTSNIQMIDPEMLTPIPGPPPKPPLAEPAVQPAPQVTPEPLRYSRTATRSIAAIEIRPPAMRTPAGMKIPAIHPVATAVAQAEPVVAPAPAPAPSVVVEALPEPAVEPVNEDADAIAERTARMSSPPIEYLAPTPPDAPLMESAAAAGSGRYEAPALSPAPLELLGSHVAGGTQPLDPVAHSHAPEQSYAPEQSDAPEPAPTYEHEPAPSDADEPAQIHAPAPSDVYAAAQIHARAASYAPAPAFAPAVAAVAPAYPDRIPLATPTPAIVTPPPTAVPTRWTKRRIWTVAVLAGASLLALGIVIGATFLGTGTRPAPHVATTTVPTATTTAPTAPAPPAAATPTPPPAATPAPPPAATPAPATPPPAPETPTATATASHVAPAATVAAPASTTGPAAVAKAPTHVATKRPSRPKTPAKKPPAHATKHTHAAPARCATLNCL